VDVVCLSLDADGDGMEITQRCGTETWTWRTGRWFDMSGTLNTMMG
jgi:hypothetical protein